MSRDNLCGVVLLCDPRHGMTELDDILLEVIRPRVEAGMQFLVLLTKADKLNRSEGAKALSIARLQAGGGEVRLFSALKRQGVEETALLLSQWVAKWTPPATVGVDLSGGTGNDVDTDQENPDGGHR
jgi:GTP-binding protein